MIDCAMANPTRTGLPRRRTCFSLSLAALPAVLAHRRGRPRRRSGSGVRGNGATSASIAEAPPLTVELNESRGRAAVSLAE